MKVRRFLDLCLCPSTILTEGKLIEILFSKISKILTRSIDLEKYCQIGKSNVKKKTRYLAYLAIFGQKSVKSIQVCFFQYFLAWKIAEIIWKVIWFDEKNYVNNHRSVRIPNFSPNFPCDVIYEPTFDRETSGLLTHGLFDNWTFT